MTSKELKDCNKQSFVLIVDDDSDIREMLLQILSLGGHKVLAARNGKEAIDILEEVEEKPCLILLDLMMPVMNGFEFLENFEAKKFSLTEIPVIAMSAASQDFMERVNGKVSSILKKPVPMQSLTSEILKYC